MGVEALLTPAVALTPSFRGSGGQGAAGAGWAGHGGRPNTLATRRPGRVARRPPLARACTVRPGRQGRAVVGRRQRHDPGQHEHRGPRRLVGQGAPLAFGPAFRGACQLPSFQQGLLARCMCGRWRLPNRCRSAAGVQGRPPPRPKSAPLAAGASHTPAISKPHNPRPSNPPRIAERLEWWTLWVLAADDDGVISKEKIRGQVRRSTGV